jgi:hypothetical protein
MKPPSLLWLLPLAFGGCLALPHLDQRSPEVRGRVVDAATWQPVKDARVEFAENPGLAVITDDHGEFVIRATLKPELFVPLSPLAGDMNIGARIEPVLRVTHQEYRPVEVDATKYENLDVARSNPDPASPLSAQGPLYLKPVKLEPLSRASRR